MEDQFGRNIHYLRVSVTDSCNLRCRYCMPRDVKSYKEDEVLKYDEIVRIVKVMASFGIDTVRITGGEPLTRPGISHLIKMIKSIDSIKRVSMTTNGVLLEKMLPELVDAGLDSVNVSLDTLRRDRFKEITGVDSYIDTWRGINDVLNTKIHLKINCVPQRGINEDELFDIAELAKHNNIEVRFIEMMPIGEGKRFKEIDNIIIEDSFKKRWSGMKKIDDSSLGNGPAVYYSVPNFKGSIGFISAVHGKFCGNCNRIRLTSEGFLKCCLASERGIDIRALLRSGVDNEGLEAAIKEVIYNKPKEHHFEIPGVDTEEREMYKIGG